MRVLFRKVKYSLALNAARFSEETSQDGATHQHHIVVEGIVDFTHTGDAFAVAFFIFSIAMCKIGQ